MKQSVRICTHQYSLDPLSGNAILNRPIMLGMDTEVIVRRNGFSLYPHEQDCPQERKVNPKWVTNTADVHGDGFAWEINTHPTFDLKTFLWNIGNGLALVESKLATNRYDKMEVISPAVYEIPASAINT